MKKAEVNRGLSQPRKKLRDAITQSFLRDLGEGGVNLIDKAAEPFNKLDNYLHDQLDTMRLNFKSDPTIRTPANRFKQVIGFSLGSIFYCARQVINLIRKPIEFTANVLRSTAILIAMIGGSKQENCSKSALWKTTKSMMENIYDTGKAAVITGAVILAGYSAGFSMFGAAVGVGVVGKIVTFTGHALWSWPSPTVTSAAGGISNILAAENAGEASLYSAKFIINNPEKLHKKDKAELEKHYNIVKNKKANIEDRRNALKELNKKHEELTSLVRYLKPSNEKENITYNVIEDKGATRRKYKRER